MSYKRSTLLVAAIVLLCLVAVEIGYNLVLLPRDFTAWTIAAADRTKSGEKYQTVLLSDSITSLTLFGVPLDESVLNLGTTAPVAVPGNYFLLRRYLERNPPPRKVLFFLSQPLLFSDIRSADEKSQFSREFSRFGEIAAMIQAGRGDIYSISQWAEQRQYFLKQMVGMKPVYVRPPLNLSWEKNLTVKEDTLFPHSVVASIAQKFVSAEMPNTVLTYMESIMSLCRARGIELEIVIEPANPLYKNAWKWSKARPALEKLAGRMGVSIVDINEFENFPNSAFRTDAVHLREEWVPVYIRAILARVGDLLGTAGINADFQRIPLDPRYHASLSDGIVFSKDGYPDFISRIQGVSVKEALGRWTDGPKTEIGFIEPLPKNFILEISAGAVPYWQNKPIKIVVGESEVEATFGTQGSWTSPTVVRIPFETDGSAESIIFYFPDVKSPEQMGIASDARKLVLFLTSIKIR